MKRQTVTGVLYSELKHKTTKELEEIWNRLEDMVEELWKNYSPDEAMNQDDQDLEDRIAEESSLVMITINLNQVRKNLVKLGQLDEEELFV